MGNNPILQKDIIECIVEYGQKSIPELEKIFKNDIKFHPRGKETIRGCVTNLKEKGLLEDSCHKDAKQGLQEKKFNISSLGYEWYIEKFEINSKTFWSKLLDVGLITSDYHYTTKKKGKNPIIIDKQHLKGIPTKRKIGFDVSNLVLNYEKKYLKITHDSLYPKNIQNTLEEFEDISQFHKNFIHKIKNYPEDFLDEEKQTTKQLKATIKKNIQNNSEIKKTYFKYKDEIDEAIKSEKSQDVSRIYDHLKPKLQGITAMSYPISYYELDNIQKLFNLKQDKKWNDESIINSIYLILLHLGEKTKLSKLVLYKHLRTEISDWQLENIISGMQGNSLIYSTISRGINYHISQLGMLLLFYHIVNQIYQNTIDDDNERHAIFNKIMKITDQTSRKFKLKDNELSKKVVENPQIPEFFQKISDLKTKHDNNRQKEFQFIRFITSTHRKLFPKIFDSWPIMLKFTNDKKILDIFTQHYFTKDKYFLFSEERDLEIDLLNSQKAIESSYRFELEKFYQDGINSLKKWLKDNSCSIKIVENKFSLGQSISHEAKRIFWIFDKIEKHGKKEFQSNENDQVKLREFKYKINKIILKNYFVHPFAEQILSRVISNHISKTYYQDLDSFFEKIHETYSKEEISKIIFKIEVFVKDIRKIILIEKVLRGLYLLDEILHSIADPLRTLELDYNTYSVIQNQNDSALSNFVSFQFFTSLYLRGPNISAEVMNDKSLKEWYLQKLEEMTKIDELRLNRTIKHRNQIIQKLTS